MVGAISFLKFQMLSYWRKAFAIRGKYDSNAGFLLILIAIVLFQYVVFLRNAAQAFFEGKTENLYALLLIVFISWIPPVLENQELLNKKSNFLFFPISKDQFAFLSIIEPFLLPTTIIPVFVLLSAIYPLIFITNSFIEITKLFFLSLSSVFTIFAFVSLLRIKLFRYVVFFSIIFLFVFFFTANKSLISDEIFQKTTEFYNFYSLIIWLFVSLTLAFLSAKYRLFKNSESSSKFRTQTFSTIKIPLKFGELIKKDFLYYWKTFDAYTSFLVAILYSIILLFGSFSFSSFSVGISLILLMCSTLTFNCFGLEKLAGLDRLSLFPVSSRDLLIAKNKSFALLIISQTFFVFLIILYKFGFIFLIISILQTVSIVLLYTAWGNNLSVKFPFKMDFYQFSFGGSFPAMIYGGSLISLLIIGAELLTTADLIMRIIVNILLVSFSLFVYRHYLQKSSATLSQNWESIKNKIQ